MPLVAFGEGMGSSMGTSGSAVSDLVPHSFDVSLAGRVFMLDLKSEALAHKSIPFLKPPQDTAATPGEQSVSPDDLWRRAHDSWHHGAGQSWLDRPDANPFRFRSSKGIDIWTEWQICLLPDTDQKDSSAETNLLNVTAGARHYTFEGSSVAYTTDITVDSPTWTAVTGYTGGAILGATSDGFTVYWTDGVDVWTTDTTTDAATDYNNLNAGGLAYTKSRLMAFGTGATKHTIYNITSGTEPTALFAHGNLDFTWTGFAEGQAAIYACGFSGDKSSIYRIAIKPDASGLDQPILASPGLPDGEIIRSIYGYLGFIFIGTDLGWRFAVADGQGNLQIGALVETPAAVTCFEGQSRFVWFGYSNYDGTSTGLGRADLTVLTDEGQQTLAYASDLMVTGQGAITSVATFQNLRVFAVSGLGFYAEHTNLVASGTIESGNIGYGLPDQKVPILLDVRYGATFAGTHAAGIRTLDTAAFTTVGTHPDTSVDNTGDAFPLSGVAADYIETQHTLTRDASVATTGPCLTRETLKSRPVAAGRERIIWPLMLVERGKTAQNVDYPMDIPFELSNLKAMRNAGVVVSARDLSETRSVTVEEYEWRPTHATTRRTAYNGTCFIELKTTA
jgi:hypothetical protein